MEWLKTLLVVLQIIAAIGVIGLVLVQQGKGADMGAAFGGGSSGGLFGAAGSANFLSRLTAIFATVFFISTLGITLLGSTKSQNSGVLSGTSAPAPVVAPEVPADTAKNSSAAPTAPVTGSSQNIPK
ncbi:preprotein translocase subunit SecG [Polynucleobacter sp. MWH-Spelu-300-X4]|uniref:preprotein translocase subunit SecG n=1 Tax=Polynucleobacter sp. MWH-Spelu-300-X4 TaxID=2689109 RepID=UPI001BFCE8E0|nr:preprotein translocase subunit SecG [Polynucleobacter sp. MWH-Spelu-300-X4]QWD79311.1 preprotein translocase subunit SecG [Polynucleobacter sp. MWH-Spelu-300-X4]